MGVAELDDEPKIPQRAAQETHPGPHLEV
jgi:hypothetical protein